MEPMQKGIDTEYTRTIRERERESGFGIDAKISDNAPLTKQAPIHTTIPRIWRKWTIIATIIMTD